MVAHRLGVTISCDPLLQKASDWFALPIGQVLVQGIGRWHLYLDEFLREVPPVVFGDSRTFIGSGRADTFGKTPNESH